MKAEIQENLINFKLSGSTRNVLFLMILIGIVSFVGGFFGLHLEARHPGAGMAFEIEAGSDAEIVETPDDDLTPEPPEPPRPEGGRPKLQRIK